jgi:hypothetical protein
MKYLFSVLLLFFAGMAFAWSPGNAGSGPGPFKAFQTVPQTQTEIFRLEYESAVRGDERPWLRSQALMPRLRPPEAVRRVSVLFNRPGVFRGGGGSVRG